MTELLTTTEAARTLRLSVATVKRLAAQGMIPGIKVGRQWRFDTAALEDWMAAGGTGYEQLVDEGLALSVAERMADPANSDTRPLEEVLRESRQ